jgi:hypothetical protein
VPSSQSLLPLRLGGSGRTSNGCGLRNQHFGRPLVKIGAQIKFDSLHKSRCTHDSLGVETFNFKRDEGVVTAVSFVQPGIRTTFAERLLVL